MVKMLIYAFFVLAMSLLLIWAAWCLYQMICKEEAEGP